MQPNTLSTRVSGDQLSMVKRDKVAHGAHGVLDPVQTYDAPTLVASVAVAFALVAERTKLDPHDLYKLGVRLLHGPEQFHKKANDQMESLRDFAAQRITYTK